ncbi:MAG: hypothetical protein WDM76_12860 [Limisphaerales bacterium]
MIYVKIVCGCGQKYAFDVQPVNDRMPVPVQCPVCRADGTTAANEIITRTLHPQPVSLAIQPAPIASLAVQTVENGLTPTNRRAEMVAFSSGPCPPTSTRARSAAAAYASASQSRSGD